jgi:hypothetical protein
MPTPSVKQHPAYEPKAQALVCPYCARGLGDNTFDRIGEFEIHLMTQHRPTDAEAREWLTASGYQRFLKDQAQTRRTP